MFGYRRTNNSGVAPTIKQVAANSAVTYSVGDALVLTSGKLAKAGATVAPEYISAEKAYGKNALSVYQVEKNQEWETTLSTAGSLVVGVKYTLSDTSDSVTATSTSGVAEVVSVAGTTSGSAVVVRF